MVKTFASKIITILKMGVFKSTSSNSKAKKKKKRRNSYSGLEELPLQWRQSVLPPTAITGEPDKLNKEADWLALMSLNIQYKNMLDHSQAPVKAPATVPPE